MVNELKSDEDLAHNALGTTRDTLDGINLDQRALRKEISDATNAIARVQGRHEAIVAELRRLDWTLASLEEQIAAGQEELASRRRYLGDRLVEAYRSEHTTLLEQVLTDGSFADAMTAAGAYLSYGDQDLRLAQQIEDDQRELDSLRALTISAHLRADELRRKSRDAAADLADQKARLADAKAALADLEARTKEIQDRQAKTLRKIARNRAEAQRIAARTAAAEAALRKQLASLLAEQKRRAEQLWGGPLDEGSGPFSWPVQGYVSQEFGCTGVTIEPPRGSCAHFHDGMDIVNAIGTPIRAPANGIVTFIGWNPYESNPAFVVFLAHANGIDTRYGHLLPRYPIKAGQVVRKGEIIGYLGNTGNTTGAHLHWEIYRGDTPINPRDLV